ncbi:CBS domain-containing protein [Propionicimonas sp.]|uniref:magnesium transporter MgtE N-terminal domain-containing protein n=1 Tax=Propionicimonas sp. TaxID=1955623 RepID=UPI0017C9CAAD|nr:CBS domain-containing protein [Propionicimonas sp.]MBU3977945.1 CBS domain-containing protein [Actinomycetota bacterium]MBA3021832.1 CBS domain-containing protein [Propionicimonas sp.]MBU3985389.1 CBS domain-containing protein [Actinomycetota bacterium]MBU4007484.1 CBS domain-containing protein [Actinomycetota bacterium]MBU4066622.1 CBS domain-containing protein [Actinomycetota bacterium]
MSATSSIFVSRIKGLPLLDPNGEQVGRVRDVVIQNRSGQRSPKVKGLVVELFAHRRIFFPMERVHSIDPNQVIVSGLVNTRRFEARERETLVAAQLFDRTVKREQASAPETIFDVAIQRSRARDWELAEVALREVARRPFQRPHVTIVDWSEVPDFIDLPAPRDAEQQAMRLSDLKAADVARELHDMDPVLRAEVVNAMDDDRLAEALEELPEDEQVDVIASLDTERAADVLEEMDPDDAADLIAELEPGLAETILARMEPEDARDVRSLLGYGAATAGGLMNPEPVVLGADATVADALAQVRQEEVTPAMAALTFICRSPLDTPTGRYLGAVNIQRLLREPPSALVAGLIDPNIVPLTPQSNIAQVSRYFATYDMVCAPVVDADRRLLGAVTVDDVLDHILPSDWRGVQLDRIETEVTDG